ncbi:MAG: hypothetical protein ACM3NV_07520 [Syntrophothermus sp.]
MRTASDSFPALGRRLAPGRLVAAAFAVAVLWVAAAGTAGAKRESPSDVTKLFSQAARLVRGTSPPTFAKARVLEVDGSASGGRLATSAADITRWRFVFDNQGSRSAYASAIVDYVAGSGFRRVLGHRSPYLEDVVIPRAPKMTLEQAVARLRRAGQRGGFSAVVLRNPLGPWSSSKPLYIFTLASGRFFAVNTATGEVSPIGPAA